jgi:hypothetical protein
MIDPSAGSQAFSSNPSVVYDGGAQPVLTAQASAVTSGTTLLVVAGVTGKRIKVLGCTILCPAAFTTAGTASIIDGFTNFTSYAGLPR